MNGPKSQPLAKQNALIECALVFVLAVPGLTGSKTHCAPSFAVEGHDLHGTTSFDFPLSRRLTIWPVLRFVSRHGYNLPHTVNTCQPDSVKYSSSEYVSAYVAVCRQQKTASVGGVGVEDEPI